MPAAEASSRRTVYLAGFDVFRADARQHGEALKALCAQYGLKGLFPLDNELGADLASLPRREQAQRIFRANLAAIRDADLLLANLGDFRGPGEADSGTAFEVGFAVALGKPVYAYSAEAGPLAERATAHVDSLGRRRCARGYLVEDFDLSKNLMLACSVELIAGDVAECLARITRRHASRTDTV